MCLILTFLVSFHPPNDVENMHLDFCKGILNVKKATINVVVFTSGKAPSSYCTEYCVLKSFYEDMLACNNSSNWLYQVKYLLCALGFGDVWNNQHVDNTNLFLKCLKICNTHTHTHTRIGICYNRYVLFTILPYNLTT